MRKLRRAYQRNQKKRNKFKQKAISVGTAAAITLGTISLQKAFAYIPDLHQLPVTGDTDSDLLADSEEDALAYLDFEPDQNRNGILDGVELAKLCAINILKLPWDTEAGPNETYKWWYPQMSLHTCDICGATVPMGPGGVTNPQLGITVSFPFYLALHYMEHGSFSYDGHYDLEQVDGRIDVPALLQALELRLPYEPNDHQLPVAEDADADLLSNKEEFAIGYQPFNDDQNKNAIPDGIELAKRCAMVVGELPSYPLWDPSSDMNETYKIEHALDGTERCHICGHDIHMGGWEIINPKLGLKYPDPNDPLSGAFLPDLALHYMEHGSFDCYGDEHQGRVDIPRLMRVLQLRFPYDPNEHQLPLDYVVESVGQLATNANDLDGDLLADSEELATGYNLYDPDQNQNLNPDGIELAKQCAEVIDGLPEEGDDLHKLCSYQYGLEICDICGEAVNMGSCQVINPKLGLSIEVHFIAYHYMSHGSFSYSGHLEGGDPLHNGRIDIALLTKILEMPHRCGDLGTIHLPGDVNKDCQVNLADFANIADKWLQSADPN